LFTPYYIIQYYSSFLETTIILDYKVYMYIIINHCNRTTSAHDRCRRTDIMWKNTQYPPPPPPPLPLLQVFGTRTRDKRRRWLCDGRTRGGVYYRNWMGKTRKSRGIAYTVAPLVIYIYKHRPTCDHKRVTPV